MTQMTITEIARLAGVSIGTVDRVLHKRGRVSQETIERVMDIVNDYGYEPNTFARNLKLSKHFTIGVMLPLLHSEYGYWNLIYEGILKAAKELSTLSVSIDMVEFDRTRAESFLEAGVRLTNRQPDALLLAPVVPEPTMKFLANHPALPYAFIDSPLPDTEPSSCVAQNPFKGGFLAGRMMHLLSKGNGTFVVVQTHRNAYNSKQRASGFISFFDTVPGSRVINMEISAKDAGAKEIEAAYAQHPDLKGIFVVNDSVHRIAQAVSSLGRKNQTVLIGYDVIEPNRKAMEEGKVDCLISQRPDFQGYTAVYQLYRKAMLNQQPEKNINVPIDIVLVENLETYVS